MNNSTCFNAAEVEDLIFELSESEDFEEVLCSESESDDDYFATPSTTILPLLPAANL